MKDAEDEAFDELAKRQGMWGGGYQAKKAMAAAKLQEPPSEWASIKAVLDEYGLQAIDFVADFKAALAQPVQEPVAWFHLHNCEAYFTTEPSEDMIGNYWTPLFTSPPQRPWVGLTDEEIKEIIGTWGDTPVKGYTRKLFDQIEAKLRSKNNG